MEIRDVTTIDSGIYGTVLLIHEIIKNIMIKVGDCQSATLSELRRDVLDIKKKDGKVGGVQF